MGLQETEFWWDWTGTGWMASENPILLIDSALPDSIGSNPRTCWLVLDAHHTIPFQQIEGTDRYEAPPRFRARLTHNGALAIDTSTSPPTTEYFDHDGIPCTSTVMKWAQPPTEWTVSLYEGEVKYTFVIIGEVRDPDSIQGPIQEQFFGDDVPFNADWKPSPYLNCNQGEEFVTNYHERPFLRDDFPALAGHSSYIGEMNPGFGMPWYALCTRIEDRFGHLVQIEYADTTSESMAVLPQGGPPENLDGCVPCQQDALAKGQIKWIKLWSGDEVKWTLAYVHRRVFGVEWDVSLPQWGINPCDNPQAYDVHGYNVIDRIYAFEGDENLEALDSSFFTIPWTDRMTVPESACTDYLSAAGQAAVLPLLSLEGGRDPIAHYLVLNSSATFLNEWKHQVRYHYEYNQTPSGNPGIIEENDPGYVRGQTRLLMTSMKSRTTQLPADPVESRRIYTYSPSLNPQRLIGIFENDDIHRVLTLPGVSISSTDFANIASTGNGLIGDIEYLFCASVSFDRVEFNWRHVGHPDDSFGQAATFSAPTYLSLLEAVPAERRPYLKLSASEASSLLSNRVLTVTALSARSSDGQMHHYRINRLAVSGGGVTSSGPVNGFVGPPGGEHDCMPSAFHIPFRWHSFTNSSQVPPVVIDDPPLDKARWISIIDEFGSDGEQSSHSGYLAARNNETLYSADGIKPGQLSRRVVNVNASGVVLKDYLWQFTPDGTLVEGSGLGEEVHYQRVSDYFGTAAIPPDMPSLLRNDLLLTRVCSVGWSAVLPEADQETKGLVRFSEYQIGTPPASWGSLTPQEILARYPWSMRIQQVASGVQMGTTPASNTKVYKNQTLYSVDLPWEVSHQIEFLTPATGLLSSLPPPAWGAGPEPGLRVTRFVNTRANEPNVQLFEQRILSSTTISSGRRQQPGGFWYYPVERQEFDAEGQLVYSISGLVRNPSDPNSTGNSDSLESLIFTYNYRETDYRFAIAIDVVPGATVACPVSSLFGTLTLPSSNSGWIRKSASPSAANLATVTWADLYGVTDVFYPDGPNASPGMRFARRWAVFGAVGNTPPDELEVYEYVFNNIKSTDGVNFLTDSPGQLTVYQGSKPGRSIILREKGFFVSPPSGQEPTAPASFVLDVTGNSYTLDDNNVIDAITAPGYRPPFFALAKTQMTLDSNGRPANAELIERGYDGSWMAVGSKSTNNLIDVIREKEIDGNVSRQTRSLIGQHMRAYSGTGDAAWIGDGATWNVQLQAYVDPLTGNPTTLHNMILKERNRYGTGPNDAWMPTISWSYRSHDPGTFADQFYSVPAFTDDPHGYATLTQYDWRMRPVRIDQYDKGADLSDLTARETKRLGTTLQFHDHADRTYMTVTFGGYVSAGGALNLQSPLDPVLRVGTEVPVVPEDFNWTNTTRPVSITYTIYGTDGGAEEIRRYTVPETHSGSLAWTSEWRYRGFGNQDVFSQSPNSPAMLTYFDGLGRPQRVLSGLPGGTPASFYELSATTYVYDEKGSVLEESRLERAPGTTGPQLDHTTNAIRSRQFHWYDTEKRRIASADVGTQRSAYTVGNADSGFAYERSVQPPEVTIPLEETGTPPPEVEVNLNGVPAGAKISFSKYDTVTGNLVYSVDPDLTVTRREYGRANRLAKIIENYRRGPGGDTKKRSTGYDYQYGRIVRMMAVQGTEFGLGSGAQNAVTQISDVAYGADILDEAFEIRSRDNSLVGQFRIPAPGGMTSSDQATIVLRYTFTGKIAERIDLRGVVFRYAYDALDRLKSITVGYYPTAGGSGASFIAKYPATMNTPTSGPDPIAPADRVGYVEYAYSVRTGQLATVLAKTKPGSGGSVIAFNRFAYDSQQNLIEEVQSIGTDTVTASTPRITYNWTYFFNAGSTTMAGRHRLDGMDYPTHGGALSRRVEFGYGSTGSTEDLLGRVALMQTRFGTFGPSSALSDVAAFTYSGEARRSKLTLGGAIVCDLAAPNVAGLPGLDMFGRLVNLNYTTTVSGTPRTLHGATYTYDISGNRLSASVTRAATADTVETNVWSQTNTYDALEQLTGTQFGTLTGGTIPAPLVTDAWFMDVFGNWNANLALHGRVTTDNRPTTPTVRQITDTTNTRNRIATRSDTVLGASATTIAYDTAGNLVSDGIYFYQYDAWNRLVQTNEASTNPSYTGPADTDKNPTVANHPVLPAAMLKHWKYDGLGRLIEVQSPYPDAEVSSGQLRAERFYYDGVRRIQELIIDPTPTIQLVLGEGEGGGEGTLGGEATQSQGEGNEPSADPETSTTGLTNAAVGGPTPVALSQMKREYIWGPGDRAWGGGVDELLVQYDAARLAWWMLSDGGGDVVAMCKKYGTGSTAYAKVAAQWTYDAYGSVLAENVFDTSSPVNRCGHKGLFADRLDVGVVVSTGGEDTDRLMPGAELIYANRNRSYSPRMGRFLQSDPHSTGTPVLESMPFHGSATSPSLIAFNLGGHYRDGTNAYRYLQSRPHCLSDPNGLYSEEEAYTDFTEMLGLLDPIPGPADFIRGMLNAMVQGYADNQEVDSYWASDWEAGDQDHTRLSDLWVTVAMLQGLKDAFDIGIPFMDEDANTLDLADSKGGGAAKGTRVSWRSPELRKLKPGCGWKKIKPDIDGYKVWAKIDINGVKRVKFEGVPDKDVCDIQITGPANHGKDISDAWKVWEKNNPGKPRPPGSAMHHDSKPGRLIRLPNYIHQRVWHQGAVGDANQGS